jgi:hypothetical protein
MDAVGGGNGRRVSLGQRRLAVDLGLVLGESLLEALDFGQEVLDEALMPLEQVKQRLRA